MIQVQRQAIAVGCYRDVMGYNQSVKTSTSREMAGENKGSVRSVTAAVSMPNYQNWEITVSQEKGA